MPGSYTARKSNFMPLKFRRTKPAIGAEHLTTTGRKYSMSRRLTQCAVGLSSSSTLVHPTDPTFVD
jgi:hypothetical protein